ncbi:MAG TPA: hypothetical protein VN032_07860 [Thermoanaerobaculia bacterium]|jgi:hypothetical protein|nr:hypothetical protein [Thermoanaerobaculia bacterium]
MPVPPTYQDADLVLRLFEMRREEKLRVAREWFRAKFFPQTFEDMKAIALGAGLENQHYRMVTGYWDLAASFVAHGILHPELFFESGGEALFVWAKIGEFVPELRELYQAPQLLRNLEKAIAMVPGTGERITTLRSRMPALRDRILQADKGRP